MQEALLEAHSNLQQDDDMIDLISKVYENSGTDMGDVWVPFLEMTDPLVQNIHACHVQNNPEYLSSTYKTTMNLNSKLKQGWLQQLQNEKQLFSTTRNANNVARVKL